MNRHLRLTFILLVALELCLCQRVDNDTVKSVTDELKATFSDAGKGVSDVAPSVRSMTVDQLEKLFIYEYKVIDVDGEASPQRVEAILNAMGQERWVSYSVTPISSGVRIYLKRRPKTYLQYVPRPFFW